MWLHCKSSHFTHPKIKRYSYETFFAPPFQIRTFVCGLHRAVSLFVFVHPSPNEAPAGAVASPSLPTSPASPRASLPQRTARRILSFVAARDSPPCPQRAAPATAGAGKQQAVTDASSWPFQVVPGSVRVCQERGKCREKSQGSRCCRPAGAASAGMLPVYPRGASTTPQAALVCANRLWNRGQKALASFCLAGELSGPGSLP